MAPRPNCPITVYLPKVSPIARPLDYLVTAGGFPYDIVRQAMAEVLLLAGALGPGEGEPERFPLNPERVGVIVLTDLPKRQLRAARGVRIKGLVSQGRAFELHAVVAVK